MAVECVVVITSDKNVILLEQDLANLCNGEIMLGHFCPIGMHLDENPQMHMDALSLHGKFMAKVNSVAIFGINQDALGVHKAN